MLQNIQLESKKDTPIRFSERKSYENATQTAKETNRPSKTDFTRCPLFSGRHKWSLLTFRLPNGNVSYCQFCYLEKLVPFAYNDFTEYYQPGTHYGRN